MMTKFWAAVGFILMIWPSTAWCQMTIELPANREVSDATVRIGDVGIVSGGDILGRRRVEQLDLTQIHADQSQAMVSRQQIELRLLLEGWEASDFEIRGASSVRVKLVTPRTPDVRVLDALRPEIASRLKVLPQDVELRLARPISSNALPYLQDSNLGLEVRLPLNVRPGLMSPRIAIMEGQRLVRTLSVAVEIQVYQDVAVAARNLNSRVPLRADDLKLERRLISQAEPIATLASFVGKQLRMVKKEDEIIRVRDLTRAVRTRAELVIRPRDVVEIVAKGRALEARVTGGIALQSGAVGDSIRVKNPSSGRKGTVVVGRVVSPGQVEIRL